MEVSIMLALKIQLFRVVMLCNGVSTSRYTAFIFKGRKVTMNIRKTCPRKSEFANPNAKRNILEDQNLQLPNRSIYLFLNNKQDSLIIQIYSVTKLHVSGIFSAHHQEFSTVHSALVSFMQVFLWPLPNSATMELQSGVWRRTALTTHTTTWNTCCHNTAKPITMYFTD
jgi:hypothetical protein